MLRIKNLINSPYQITLADGSKEMLGARGEITADVHPQHLHLYRQLGYFQIDEVGDTPKPEKAQDDDEDIDALRAQYTELTGEEPDKRWKEKRLQDEIDKALEG